MKMHKKREPGTGYERIRRTVDGKLRLFMRDEGLEPMSANSTTTNAGLDEESLQKTAVPKVAGCLPEKDVSEDLLPFMHCNGNGKGAKQKKNPVRHVGLDFSSDDDSFHDHSTMLWKRRVKISLRGNIHDSICTENVTVISANESASVKPTESTPTIYAIESAAIKKSPGLIDRTTTKANSTTDQPYGLLVTEGRLPQQTDSLCLATDILRDGMPNEKTNNNSSSSTSTFIQHFGTDIEMNTNVPIDLKMQHSLIDSQMDTQIEDFNMNHEKNGSASRVDIEMSLEEAVDMSAPSLIPNQRSEERSSMFSHFRYFNFNYPIRSLWRNRFCFSFQGDGSHATG